MAVRATQPLRKPTSTKYERWQSAGTTPAKQKAKRLSIHPLSPNVLYITLPTDLPAYQERKPSGAMPSGRRQASGVRSRRVQVFPFSSGLSPLPPLLSPPVWRISCNTNTNSGEIRTVFSLPTNRNNSTKAEGAETTAVGKECQSRGVLYPSLPTCASWDSFHQPTRAFRPGGSLSGRC